jgi:TonB family protein
VAKLQEQRGAFAEAESTLLALHDAQPTSAAPYHALAALYTRAGQFDRAVAALERAAALDPGNPNSYQILATFYYEKVSKDPALPPAQKESYIRNGIGATDKALAIQADFVEALVYKNLFLRAQANLETDPARRQALLDEANQLRGQAMEFRRKNGPPPPPPPAPGAQAGAGMPPPPPPPPPPSAIDGDMVPADAVRVGGAIKPPTQLVNVKPEYPPDAREAHVQGVVILDIMIDRGGAVGSAHVVRSIPQLDEAALAAVRQWKFSPTLVNGAPVPVLATVTVNFALK